MPFQSVYGYAVRPPFPGEEAMFRRRPEVAGMAGEDGWITVNPHSPPGVNRQAVVKNEAIRLFQRDNGLSYNFPLTESQRNFLAKTEYGADPSAARETIVARILTGDPSAGDVTPDQRAAAAMTQAFIDMQERARPIGPDPFPERKFQDWYGAWAGHTGIAPNPDDPEHHYNYRAAFSAGATPAVDPQDDAYHWPSAHKRPDHPNRFVPLPGGGVLDSLLNERVK